MHSANLVAVAVIVVAVRVLVDNAVSAVLVGATVVKATRTGVGI